MMQWFRRNSPGFLSVKEEEGAGPSMASWMEAFKSHWVQAHSVMEQKEGGNPVQPDQVITIFNHMDQMVHLLLLEMNNDNTSIGPIMDETFSLEVFGCTVDWALNADGAIVPCQASLLKLFESLISQAQLVGGRQSILVHKPILQPLLRLLDSCARSPAPDIEKRLVILLNQICVSIAKDDSLLEFFFNESPEDDMPKFSVFSLLIPFLYKEGDIGQFARDSILLILSASRKSDSVGLFIAEHSNFCPVLATGLSGLYSTLPRKLRHSSDDWHCITRRDIDAVPELKAFHSTLEFCNAVVQVGHQYVQEQLLNFIYQGFLLPVIGPALNQPSLEEIVASTAYLEMFFTSVTEPPLLRVLVRFLLCASNDSVPLLEALVTRISSNSRLCLVSLSLFNTLLSLNCEDLIYELILKYLVPCTHVMVSQTKSIRPVDIYTRSSEKFLSLIPNSCLHGGGEEEETDKSDQRSAVNGEFLRLIPNSCLHGGGEEEETDKSDQRSAVNGEFLRLIPNSCLHGGGEEEETDKSDQRSAVNGEFLRMIPNSCLHGGGEEEETDKSDQRSAVNGEFLRLIPNSCLHGGGEEEETDKSDQRSAVNGEFLRLIPNSCLHGGGEEEETDKSDQRSAVNGEFLRLIPNSCLHGGGEEEETDKSDQRSAVNGEFLRLIPNSCLHGGGEEEETDKSDQRSAVNGEFLRLIPNSCLHGGGEEEEADKSDRRSAVNDSGYEDAGFPDAFDSLFASYSIGPSQGTRQNGPKVPKQASPPNKSPRESLLLSFDSYLADAREQVQSCYVACLRWSLPYDGHNPDPMMFREDDSLDHASSCATLTSVGTLAADEAEGRMYANSTMRQSALSVSNSYFTAPRLSSLYGYSQFGAPYGISSLELTLGQEDFFIALEGLEPLELNSHGGPKGSEEGGSSSTLSTPVHSRRPGDRPPPDYLKLTYDEDSHGFSAGEEYESDFPGSASAGAMTSNPFVLMGWSQVEDEDAFVELLNRVRCGSKLTGVCTQAHMDLIDEFYDRVTAESPKTEDTDALDKEQTPKPEQDQDDGVSDDPAQKEAETMKEEPGVYTPLLMMPTPAEDAYRGSFKNPNVGPFLGVVLHKAEHMVTNSLFVNLQLTGLLARLAVYPQPLLASFLLNDQLVFQPSVKSLVQILSNVKHRVDSWALTVENWDELLTRGRDFLAGREERYRHDVAEMQRASMPKGRVTGPNKTRSFSLLSNGPSQSSGANRRLKMKRAGSLEHSDTGYRYIHRADSPKSALDLIKTKNVVYCAIVLEEFLQEMAATCQEHALSTRLDLLPGQFI